MAGNLTLAAAVLALLPERNPGIVAFRWLRSFLASPPANF